MPLNFLCKHCVTELGTVYMFVYLSMQVPLWYLSLQVILSMCSICICQFVRCTESVLYCPEDLHIMVLFSMFLLKIVEE